MRKITSFFLTGKRYQAQSNIWYTAFLILLDFGMCLKWAINSWFTWEISPKTPHETWPHPYNEHWTICFTNGYNGKKPRRVGENLVCYFCQPRNNVSFVQHTKHHLGAVPKLLKMNSALCYRQTALSENSGYSLCMSEF